jgi:hypothetical protein
MMGPWPWSSDITMPQTPPQSVSHVHSMPNRLSPYPSPCHNVSSVDHVRPLHTATTRPTSACQSYLLTSVVEGKAMLPILAALGTATDVRPEQPEKAPCARTAGGKRRRGGASLVRGRARGGRVGGARVVGGHGGAQAHVADAGNGGRDGDRRQARAVGEGVLCTHGGRRARARRCVARAREGTRWTRGRRAGGGRARQSAGAPRRCWLRRAGW